MTYLDGQSEALAFLDDQLDDCLERLFALLRVPSISTDPKYAPECGRAAQILSDELASLGFRSRVQPTGGHPMVVAHHEGPAPHIQFYGHYDVQPVDPVELWRGDPFEPKLEQRGDGSKFINARGASDDKGQLRTFIEACRAWKAVSGALPCRVTIFLEGEEESGSPSLEPFLRAHSDELQADLAVICDTSMWDVATPAITFSLRGNVAGEVRIHGPSRDLHSGLYGGAARNPLQVLAEILASLRDEQGRVTLEDFYDGVRPISAEMKAAWERLAFDGDAYLRDVGLQRPAGEEEFSVLEQIWARPTVEINGVSGGYTGEGFKTVIPSEAIAKVSFRLVGDQDPKRIWSSFERHVRARLPSDCTAMFRERGGSRAILLDSASNEMGAVRAALASEWGAEPAMVGSGGSIPVVNAIRDILGLNAVMVGFALNDDNIHSPNEKYDLRSFHKGARSWVRILSALGAQALPAGAEDLQAV